MRSTALLLLLLTCLSSSAQKNLMEREDVRQVVISNDSIYLKADIYLEEANLSPKPYIDYYWFASNRIHKTAGGYSGKVLHGLYEQYYTTNKSLREKGYFRYGTKHGTWKSWYPDGKLEAVINWKKGYRHGDFQTYDQTGTYMKTGRFVRGQLHGAVEEYKQDSLINITEYKRGKKIEEAPLPQEQKEGSRISRMWRSVKNAAQSVWQAIQFWNKDEETIEENQQ